LSDKVRETSFQDAKNTYKDHVLIGPPVLEFAPFSTVPSNKRRNDSRMGTIDQDPEFIQFLESLTNPVAKTVTVPGTEIAEPKEEEKVTTTPLIEAIREMKANKQSKKEAKAAKHARQESRDTAKGEKVGDKKILVKGSKDGNSEKKGRASRAERAAAKEAAKAAAKEEAQQAASSASGKIASSEAPAASERRRDRGNAGIAAKIQRDLGITPAGRSRGSKKDKEKEKEKEKEKDATHSEPKTNEETTDTPADSTTSAAPEKSSGKSGRKDGKPSRSERRKAAAAAAAANEKGNAEGNAEASKSTSKPAPKTPTILKKPAAASNADQAETTKATSTSKGSAQAASAETDQTASSSGPPRQAFLKHANASQGINEPLLNEAMSAFGAVTSVEIDKRKGFAYVDFAEPEGLRAAIAASPVKVAQGSVQVLERRERPAKGGANNSASGGATGGSGGGGGGRGRGRGKPGKGGQPKGNQPATTPAANAPSVPG
jgi:regulator of nonsense transcripts 3